VIAAQNTNKKFRPFEMDGCVASLDDDETEEERKAISVQKFTSNVTMVACELKDDKTKALYEKMNTGGGSSSNIRTEKQLAFERSSFSQRLQTENPFEDFRRAVEDAVIAKSKRPKKVFQPDQAFYKESDDIGMCLSMHQPWASLLVHGFKRFEGREWTSKFRGPLYIHATQRRPEQPEIDEVEGMYRALYRSVGDHLPAFPERYLTGCLVGRIDLVDVIS
jgi:hypothetical protein